MSISSLERKLVLDNFRKEWPKERLKTLTLSEYFMVGNKSTLAYCLEFGDARHLGSIKGGDSSKFGIYERKAESKGNRSFICYDERYSWKSKYGSSAEEAFSKIKDCLLDTISLIEKQDLDAIEALDFEPALKWKIAFIYQNHDSPCILPIYSLPMLQKLSETLSLNSHSQAYKFLMENIGDCSSLDYGVMLWQKISIETKERDVYNESLQSNQAVQYINTLRNVILFGPPGTGKTYNTVTEALDIIEPDIAEYNSDGRGHLQYQFSELVKAQRIQFVTALFPKSASKS